MMIILPKTNAITFSFRWYVYKGRKCLWTSFRYSNHQTSFLKSILLYRVYFQFLFHFQMCEWHASKAHYPCSEIDGSSVHCLSILLLSMVASNCFNGFFNWCIRFGGLWEWCFNRGWRRWIVLVHANDRRNTFCRPDISIHLSVKAW